MAKKLMPDIERFLKKVSINQQTKCWEWLAARCDGGYGKFHVGSRADNSKRQVSAHRFSYEYFKVKIPDGFVVDHICKNRKCVNPEHLRHVTPKQNVLENSDSFVSANAKKTHCLRDHEFTRNNTRIYQGKRICRACCRNDRNQKWFAYKASRRVQPKIGRELTMACNKGHPWTEENTLYLSKNNRRVCRPCKRVREKKQYDKERGLTR